MENLGVDIKLMIAQGINFILFFLIVKKFVVGPFNDFLEEERNREKEKLALVENARRIEEGLKTKEQEFSIKSRNEMQKIIEETKKNARAVKDDLLKEAEKEAAGIKEKMRSQLEEEKEEMYRDIKKKVADLSFEIVGKGLSGSLDEETKKKVTTNILKNLN